MRQLWTGRMLTAIARSVALGAGVAAMFVANSWLEILMIGESPSAERSAGTAVAGGGDVVFRLKEAIVTGAAPFPRMAPVYLLLGLA